MALTSNTTSSSYFEFEKECRQIHTAWDRPGQLGRTLANRTPIERQQIKENYKAIYGKDLIERLQNDLEVPICAALYMWMLDQNERDAMVARDALTRSEPDYKALVEIYARRKSSQLFFANHHIAKCDAIKLYGATKLSSGGIDEATILEIFSKRSIPRLRLAFFSYKQIYGHDFTATLKRESSGEFEESLRIVIQCMCDPFEYYSHMMLAALKGGAAAKRVLTRVIMGSVEVGMQKVSAAFEKRNGMKIQDVICEIIADGDYRDFLRALTNVKTSN